MSYTIETINPIAISGIENPFTLWEVTVRDSRNKVHKHRINDTEFKSRMKSGEWGTYPSANIHLMSR